MNGKVKETLQSRKFWITILLIGGAGAMFMTDRIDIDRMMEIIRWAAGIYVGGLSVEDGFKKLGPFVELFLKDKGN